MTPQQILTKAIEKAIAGGYELPLDDPTLSRYDIDKYGLYDDTDFAHPRELAISIEAIIFNHEFAKALWGEAELTGLDFILGKKDMYTGAKRKHYWQYHLQQMVTADDPIAYLEEHI